jgi:hypothetical protein
MRREITDLDDVELQHHGHRSAHFGLHAMHLEAHVFENDLGSRGRRNLLNDDGDLGSVDSWRWEKNVKLHGQEPERSNIEVTGLNDA